MGSEVVGENAEIHMGVSDGEFQMPKLVIYHRKLINAGVPTSKQCFEMMNWTVRIIWLPHINEGKPDKRRTKRRSGTRP